MSSAGKHYVYRCYDASGLLLYVGCTRDVAGRLQVHASSWNNPASAVLNMRMASHEVEEFPTFEAARAAEREAIANEAPLANLHHQRERITAQERRIRLEEYLEQTRPPVDLDLVAELNAVVARFS